MSATASAPPAAELRPVRGPSAVGGGRRRFFDLTWLLATTRFKQTYADTAFGYAWTLAQPLLLFAVLYVVFTKIIRFEGIDHYAAFLLFNIMLFSFFSNTTTQAVSCVLANEHMVRKMQFPRLVIPLSVVLEGLFNVLLSLVAVLIILPIIGVAPRWGWLGIPLLVSLMAAVTAGTSILLSALYVRFRDIAPVWGVLSLVIFYASPVLYTAAQIPGSLRALILVNPFAPLLELGYKWVINPDAPSVIDTAGSAWGYIGPAVVAVVIVAWGFWAFFREAPHVAESV
jgi:ABC-2 type transport system permease protein